MGKEDESWFWNKRMEHIHFENLVNISNKKVVREMSEIKSKTNVVCKHYHHGNQTKVEIKTKEYSTMKPLEIMHIDLCVPMRIKGL